MNPVTLGTLTAIIVPLGIVVVLPIAIAYIAYKKKQHETNKRSEIVMAAIEKNSDIDVQEFLSKLNPPQKTYKERMLNRLHQEILWGTICLIGGAVCIIAIVTTSLINGYEGMDIGFLTIFGIIPLAIGIGLLVAYKSGKKSLDQVSENE
jgi:signal recognition particleprotein